ncbi:hypothetical protein H6A07_00220 [Olsenella uli]|uniref:hypothetical protein n=1 Tax=Olsenella uli TaxID=133926 RepID=UPI0019577F04|nr:hypothetical protein [Olsenella uli]MBM6675179.1 hypothetical protein [Olsenella uli]
MAHRVWSVGRVAEVAGFARAASRGRDERVLVRVLVDPACPRELTCAVRDALVPERPGAVVEVLPLAGAAPGPEAPDAVLALVGPDSPREPLLAHARAGAPVALVVEGLLEAPRLAPDELGAASVDVVAASSTEALGDKLAAWLASVTDKPLALAANFRFCRRAVVDALVSRCALENAAVGAVRLIPGSDLPVMTANQLRLALDVAAAYGRPLEPARAAELLGVTGAALGWRSVARALLGALPGLGVPLRAGVAYAGTLATGTALRLRFEAADRPGGPAGATEGDLRPQVLLDTRGDEGDGYVTIGGDPA